MKNISLDEAVALLNAGKVGVIPTDTVYGVVARADNPGAVARCYSLKQRVHKPGTVIAAHTQQLIDLGVPEAPVRRVERWWPNSLSVEMPLGDNLAYLHQETGRQAFRVVPDERVRRVLEQTGPLVTSSANQPGQPGAVTIDQAQAYFGELADFYVDGGDLSDRQPSTIIGLDEHGVVTVYRQGAVDVSTLDKA